MVKENLDLVIETWIKVFEDCFRVLSVMDKQHVYQQFNQILTQVHDENAQLNYESDRAIIHQTYPEYDELISRFLGAIHEFLPKLENNAMFNLISLMLCTELHPLEKSIVELKVCLISEIVNVQLLKFRIRTYFLNVFDLQFVDIDKAQIVIVTNDYEDGFINHNKVFKLSDTPSIRELVSLENYIDCYIF